MSDELIPKSELGSQDKGSYFINEARLTLMAMQDIQIAGEGFIALMEANPEFEFLTEQDIVNHGIWIRWRRRKDMLHWHGNVMCYQSECDPRNIIVNNPPSNWRIEKEDN